jgi:serine/threonine protein kinase
MGEVYRARDTRLGRSVALKTIAPTASADALWRDRFQREARIISSLQHSHLCPLFDVGCDQGVDYLVMQLCEGETLASRLSRGGSLPVRDAVTIAIEVAEALDHAHRAGVMHRDVKPGNVMLTKSGAVLLDFGLAAHATPPDANTVTRSLTDTGVIIGTVQYMAPEQVEGREADARTDIFALGAILFEMLAGRPAFSGQTHAALAASVLSTTPPLLSTLRDDLPPMLPPIVAKCLEKDPDRRWQTTRDLADALRWAMAPSVGEPVKARPHMSRSVTVVLALLTVIGLAVAWMLTRSGRETGPGTAAGDVVRFSFDLPDANLVEPAVSPDGRRVAFVAVGREGDRTLWVREVAGVTPHMVPGTNGANHPFWSPDSRMLGFVSGSTLKRVDVSGGPPQIVAGAPSLTGVALGADWGRDGTIVFSRRSTIASIGATGGTPTTVATLDLTRQENSTRWPQFLPDGRRFLYIARSGRPDQTSAYLASLDGAPPVRLFNTQSNVAYSVTGHLLYARDGTLVAHPFDADAGRLHGEPRVVASGLPLPGSTLVPFSISRTGVLAFAPPLERSSEVRWFDRSGRDLGPLSGSSNLGFFRLSPDERRIAANSTDRARGERSIWIIDVQTGTSSRFTFPGTDDMEPVWSPDGRRIVFMSFREGPSSFFVKAADGSGREERLLGGPGQKDVHDWSPDGRFILHHLNREETGIDLLALPAGGNRTPITVAATRADEVFPRFSPDGRWVAYQSNESGRYEVYVQPFPPTGAKWQVSTAGASRPRWRSDGRELFFVTSDRHLAAVDVDGAGSAFSSGPARLLFPVPDARLGAADNGFEVTRGGRFLINLMPRAEPSPIHVILNWPALLTSFEQTSR